MLSLPDKGIKKGEEEINCPVYIFNSILTSFLSSENAFSIVCTLPGRDAKDSQSLEDPQCPHFAPPPVYASFVYILDSSFNPPTLAHRRMALSALQSASPPRRMLLLLAINNADKAPKPAAFQERLAMMLEFARDIQGYQEDGCRYIDVTIDLGLTTEPIFASKAMAIENSGFYSLSRSIQGVENVLAPVELIFLAGFDTLIRILNPDYYKEDVCDELSSMQVALDPFFSRSKLRITTRPGCWKTSDLSYQEFEYLEEFAENAEQVGARREWRNRILIVRGREIDQQPVSSTSAREACSIGDTDALKNLVGPRVWSFLLRTKLYGQSQAQAIREV